MTLTSVTSDDVSKTWAHINSGMCFDQIVRSTVLTHHIKQLTNISSSKCRVDVRRDYPGMCLCAGMSPVCGAQRWVCVRLFGSYLSRNTVGTYPLVSSFSDEMHLNQLPSADSHPHTGHEVSHLCVQASLCQIVTGMLTCLGDDPWSRIWAHLRVVCVCACACSWVQVYFCPILYYVTINWPQT